MPGQKSTYTRVRKSGATSMYPVANVMMGVELLWGKRTDNDGTTGDDVRYQFSVKYNFSVEL